MQRLTRNRLLSSMAADSLLDLSRLQLNLGFRTRFVLEGCSKIESYFPITNNVKEINSFHVLKEQLIYLLTLYPVYQVCQTRGLLGAHIVCWQSCRELHDAFDLKIITSPGNGLCNVARSMVDLQKKVITSPVSPNHHPSSEIEFCGTKWS